MSDKLIWLDDAIAAVQSSPFPIQALAALPTVSPGVTPEVAALPPEINVRDARTKDGQGGPARATLAELNARLRANGLDECDEAIDRIEQLVATNEALTKERNKWRRAAEIRDEGWKISDDARIEAEAKLAKAVEALERIAGVKGPYSHPFPESYEGYGAFAIVTSRETLEEIKGESHE